VHSFPLSPEWEGQLGAAPVVGLSLAYAFPTPLTCLMAVPVGFERMSFGRTLGVGIAFAGAITLAFSRTGSPSGEGFWVLLAMLAPISIAAGNIYWALLASLSTSRSRCPAPVLSGSQGQCS
jgi:hypothetical protein